MKDGDEVSVGDGAGRRMRGVLAGSRVRVSGQVQFQEEPRLRLFCAIPDPSRFDWMIQKCTELGALDFYPLICERSDRQAIRLERLEKIIEEAAAQSGRFMLPRIHKPAAIADALRITERPAFLLEPGAELWLESAGGAADFWIGPEGGFSPGEKAILAGLTPAAVSNHVLRVETAAVAALARRAALPRAGGNP